MAVRSNASINGSGVEMLLSVFSTVAVGLAFVAIFLTIVIPFVVGFFDHREIP